MSTLKNSSHQISNVRDQLDMLVGGTYKFRLSRINNTVHAKAYMIGHHKALEVLESVKDRDYQTIIERLIEFRMVPPETVQNRWYRNTRPLEYWNMAFDDIIEAILSMMHRFVIGVSPVDSVVIFDYKNLK